MTEESAPRESAPRLLAQETIEGASDALGRHEGWQFRDGTPRLVTRSVGRVAVRTVRSSAEPPLFDADAFSVPLTDLGECLYVTPTGAGVAVSRRDAVTYHSRSGVAEWRFPHTPWGDGTLDSGACAETPDGRHLLAVAPGAPDEHGEYPGDRCVLLASDTGKLLDETLLPTFSAAYGIDAPFPQSPAFLLTAGQGEEDAYSWRVDVADERLHLVELASGVEHVTGARNDRILVQEIGGGYLQVRSAASDGTLTVTSEAEPDDMNDGEEPCFTGEPGFVDGSHVLAAVAGEWWAEEADHFLLDAEDLTVRHRLRYSFPAGPDPKALNDGTWITVEGDDLCRWRLA